ncbi:MAG: DNA-binding protein [Anaerolineaceae bacterium]|nr:DNA-binding protein [Anaerolineaceae bacterium]
MQTYTFRLKPGDLLKESLILFAKEKKITAGVILTCVGSLTHAHLRFSETDEIFSLKGPFEIISLVGTFSKEKAHVHMSISDGQGILLGGHLWDGCRVYTTAEIVVMAFPNLVYSRQFCEQSGLMELVVEDK